MWTLNLGRAGWVRLAIDDWPGWAYLRFVPNDRGRWLLREMFLDSAGSDPITQRVLTRIPLADVEALINGELSEDMTTRMHQSSPPGGDADGSNMAVLASYFASTPGSGSHPERHWVHAAYYAQWELKDRPGQDSVHGGKRPEVVALMKVKRGTGAGGGGERVTPPDSDYHLDGPPGPDGLSDEFLGKVARAYYAAIARHQPPNRAIADDIGHQKTRTVERWVYLARQRRIMPAARNGGARG